MNPENFPSSLFAQQSDSKDKQSLSFDGNEIPPYTEQDQNYFGYTVSAIKYDNASAEGKDSVCYLQFKL